MTSINAIINSGEFHVAAKRIDIWHESGGIGRWELLLDNTGSPGASEYLDYDQVASNLGINGVNLMQGYVDDIISEVRETEAVFSKHCRVKGRNYGRDLANKILTKNYSDWRFDDLIENALDEADSEIIFPSTHEGPYVSANFNKTYLQYGFVEIAQKIGYDLIVLNDKLLRIWALADAPDSGILLKAVAGDPDNNILKIESVKSGVDVRNSIIVSAGMLNDHWTEGGNAIDWTVTEDPPGGGSVADDYAIMIVGANSLRVTSSDGVDYTEVSLSFPRYNHDYLDFEKVGSEQCTVYCQHDAPSSAKFYVILEDDEGNRIKWLTENLTFSGKVTKHNFTVGTDAPFGGFLGGWETWYYEVGSSFTWRVVRVAVRYVYGGSGETHFWVDGLKMPSVEVFAIAEEEE